MDNLNTLQEIAQLAFRSPGLTIACPACNAAAVSAAWHVVDLTSRRAMIDLVCSACDWTTNAEHPLPEDAPDFFPLERVSSLAGALERQAAQIASRVRQCTQAMPAAAFTTHPLWVEARWSATTFQWHPTSDAPPIMGLVFDNAAAGLQIFSDAAQQMNHADRFDEIRVSIIEGVPDELSEQQSRPGYSVHICPDPEALAAHATMDDFVLDPRVVPFLGQWNRHYPVPGQPALLPRFKREFEKHQEYLLAPVVKGADGQFWCKPELGIIKNVVLFRDLSEITPDDPDAGALVLPQLITPPV